jgi:hypothetical protein
MNNSKGDPEAQSRAMFVARLEAMSAAGDKWVTVEAVLALLNDCDMLATRHVDLPIALNVLWGEFDELGGWHANPNLQMTPAEQFNANLDTVQKAPPGTFSPYVLRVFGGAQ